MALHKPDHIISLATSGMLVSVDISVWTATKQDRQISDEVTSAKKADREAGRFVKHLLANDPDHKRVLNYRQAVYNWLQRRTYDWSASQRLLPVVDLQKFMQEYAGHEKAFNDLVEAFLTKLPSIISNMAFAQGEMFNRNDYPTVPQVRDKFRIQLYTAPVPEGDYRCQIAQDLADDLHNNYVRQSEAMVKDILSRQYEQLLDVMQSLSHCCELEVVTDADGSRKVKRRKIYDTTLQKAQELCHTFREFNLSGDPKLEEMRTSLADVLSGVDPGKLKESDGLRQQIKSGVDTILSKFGNPDHVPVTDGELPEEPESPVPEDPQAFAEASAEADAVAFGSTEVPTPETPSPKTEDDDTELSIRDLIAKYTKK